MPSRRHALLVILLVALTASVAGAKQPPPIGNYDVRAAGAAPLRSALARAAAGPLLLPTKSAAATLAQGLLEGTRALQKAAPGASVRVSAATLAPEQVLAGAQPLSPAAPGQSGIDVVRAFLRDKSSLYRLTPADVDALRLLGESVSRSGLRMVRVDQHTADGLPLLESETRFLLDRDGRVLRSLGTLVPTPDQAAAHAPITTATQAVAAALRSVGLAVDAAAVQAGAPAAPGAWQSLTVADSRIVGPVKAQLGWFPLASGALVPAYRVLAFTRGSADWNVVVSAVSGDLFWRKNMRSYASTQEARFSVYVQADGTTPAVSPAPHEPTDVTPGSGTQFPAISRTIVNMSAAQNLTYSPDGWIPDGGTTTTGNNVDAYLDTDADNAPDTGALDDNGRPVGNPDVATNNRDFLGSTPRDFDYTPAPLGGNPDAGDAPTTPQSQRGAVTHLFYLANWYHDQLYGLGFDEAAGNFQSTNFSGMGTGGDPVLAEAQDGSGTDNSNFSTPPDGQSGRMQMFLFDFPTPERDGALDATIVLHELTHGLSNRLIGDGNGLIWDEGGGLGEGWSDFYALSLLHDTNADDPNAEYAAGAYATYQLLGLTDNYLYGIRRFPYSTDNSVNPLTWADVDDVTYDPSGGITPSPLIPFFAGGGALEVHNVGELWALSLWEVRSRIIADPAGANGDVPTGNATTLQLVTDALKMTPLNPSFTEARDALIAADCAASACANEKSIWGGFADRGLGYGAVAPLGQAGILGSGGHMGVGESFKLPYLDVAGDTVDDSLGNNNGAIDPGEPILLTVGLFNPWRNTAMGVANATATLTSSTPGVTILTNTATYGAIPAQGTTGGTPFLFTLSTSALCGQSLRFTVTTVSSLGTTSADFTLRVGAAAGSGAPITYTRTVPGGLAIPDTDLAGVTDTFPITDDLEISDLDFRLDSLTHTFTGDLAVELRAPNGYGTDLIYLRGIFIGSGDGDNFTDTVIDDQATNDLNLSSSGDAPFTGDWLPAFNSPIWGLFGIPNLGPDPVGQLSRSNGLSTQGNWQVHVTDEAEGDIGTLNTWSLIVTPKAFACAAFVPAVAVTGTKTVSGSFLPGGTVTYTVTLTNNGSAVQADNPGHEFTDTLPGGLTLVSAAAGSGTVATSGNTVTWDGSIGLGGGSVTIGITATVNAGTGGTTIANQGSISFDADVNGTNESTAVTDDPGTAAANDPTSFLVATPPTIGTHTKEVAGSFREGGTVTYTVKISNTGTVAQADNPGDEFTDVLPSSLTLVSASATSGTAVADVPNNTVHWNGSIAAGATVTLTITATVHSGTGGTTIGNQGTIRFDADGNGINESSLLTDDPSTAAANDPTSFAVVPAVPIPAIGGGGLLLLGLMLAGAGLLLLRPRG